MWVLFLKTTSQPFADQPPLPALTGNAKSRGQCQNNPTSPASPSAPSVVHSQYGVVPEDTDRFGALLSGDQAELHGDGFVQRVLQQLVVVVHRDTHHWCVDDRTLRHPEANENKTPQLER